MTIDVDAADVDGAIDAIAPEQPRRFSPLGLPRRTRSRPAPVPESEPEPEPAPAPEDLPVFEMPDLDDIPVDPEPVVYDKEPVSGPLPRRLPERVRADMAIGRPVQPDEELVVRRTAAISAFDTKIRQLCELLEKGASLAAAQDRLGIGDAELVQMTGSPLVEAALGRSQEMRRRVAADRVFSLQDDAVAVVEDVMNDSEVEPGVRLRAATTVLKSTGAMTERPTTLTVVQNLFESPEDTRFKRRLEQLKQRRGKVLDTDAEETRDDR